ncbi:MAG TPA: enoyl-CoA hydratase-related protein, partial [bacterium]
ACISPYVIRRVGENRSRELFLSGERIDAQKAFNFGFVNQVVPPEKLETTVKQQIAQLLSSGPNALAICKDLLEKVPQLSLGQAKKYTAEAIAELRVSDEGQEGMKAFFEKRKPNWTK